MALTVNLDRCHCVHSMSQVVDVAIQSLLYLREVIPEPMQQLMQFDAEHKVVVQYQRICESLRQLFKSRNARLLREIVFVLGPTPYMAKEVYKIPIRLCDDHAGSVDFGCGESCESLCSREVRSVFMTLQKFLHAGASTKGPNTKFFIFARVSERLFNADTVDDIEEDDSFEVPSDELIKNRHIIVHEIHVPSCRKESQETESDHEHPVKAGFWLRVVPFVLAQA
uniref:HORMA domain-containing protein n=1 Tax=Panagrellus redivivus TaxID=6233 RepID=A0A7E4USR4_PANRE